MIKKIVIIGLLGVLMLTAVFGCSWNKAIIDLNYEYNYATVCQAGVCTEYKITKWDDYDNDAVSVWTEDGQMIYGSLNNITLYKK